MKESKYVSVTKHNLKHTDRVYEVYINKIQDGPRSLSNHNKDVGCQYDFKRNNKLTCACRNTETLKRRDMYFSGLAKQVYAYHGTRSVTDVGVGSVKALQRKRVRRIYLPETDDRGIGSEDLSAFVTRRTRPMTRSGYYDNKKTSSKCIGGIIECNTGWVLSEKLSPIVQTRSGATSPSEPRINIEMASNTVGKNMITNTTQVETEITGEAQYNGTNTKHGKVTNINLTINNSQEPTCSKDKVSIVVEDFKLSGKKANQVDRAVSSDSLVQHVHNLENPSDYKQSRTSVDLIENKLEREYRKMFSIKTNDKRPNEKTIPDVKSTSVLRRRFEALRRGLVKKEDSKKDAVIANRNSGQASAPIRKDVSIASDPPSLEGRSYSNTKIYSPFHFNTTPEKSICKPSTSRKEPSSEKRNGDNLDWSRMEDEDSDCQGVKGMFKLWGTKFNLDEESYKKPSTSLSSYQKVNTFTNQKEKKAELKLEKTVKKDGKKFFFFKKKSKDKSKPYKSKKGVTAGRCEVGDGLMIKIDGNLLPLEESKKKMVKSEEILRKQWLHKYLTNAIESKKSVQIRWHNKTYATSSSTVFELMDTVYKDTGIVFRSISEMTTGESSFYRSRTQHVNFAHHEIEAWMVPQTIFDSPKQKRMKLKRTGLTDREVKISAQKWFIDKAKAFSRKIEVVLHTKNVVHAVKESSSEYLRIDIPKGFFIDSSSDDNRKPSSDEEVYKIVEYETESYSKRNEIDMETGDHTTVDDKLIVKKRSQDFKPNILESVIVTSPARRDVVIQGSDVNIPKRFDVIGVGIITQRDSRETRKPILNIQDYLTDEESDRNLKDNQKKCEFAESYLQDYYRHWTPLGIDLFSWYVSDSHLRCNSENSQCSFHNQGDGSKSCPNIYDDFQTSAMLSPNNGCAPCSPCKSLSDQEDLKSEDFFQCKWLKKFKVKKSSLNDSARRGQPKDSLEVFKRRKIYAASGKSKWRSPSDSGIEPNTVPNPEDKEAQDTTDDISKSEKAGKPFETKKILCRKHVSMKADGTYEYISKSDGAPEGILMFKGASGCDVCREAAGVCPKHATVDPVSSEIPDPPCKPVCLSDPKPPCRAGTFVTSDKLGGPSNKKRNIPPLLCQTLPHKFKENKTPSSKPAAMLAKGSPCKECHPPTESPTDANLHTNKPSVLCPHFPPCRKTQSCQKSVDLSQYCPDLCPGQIPYNETNKSTECSGPPCLITNKKDVKGEMETHLASRCDSPPCSKLPTTADSGQFPWPLKSQKSNQSMHESAVTTPRKNRPYECEENCPLSPKYSSQTIALKRVNSDDGCKPECPNRSYENVHSNCPTSCASPLQQQQSPSALLADFCKNETKLSGVLQKHKASKNKTCSKECSALDDDDECGVIRLSSKERITIRMKEPTPSTEEIREGMNIKVKDDDGNTLYERIDYKKPCKPCRPCVLGDLYKSSDVNRISTPLTIKNVQTSQERDKAEDTENKSNASIANLIEIQFKLKVTQGDKTTELNIGENKNNEHVRQIKKVSSTPQDVFVVKNNDDHLCVKPSPKNDVNIRIVIKNLKSKSDKRKNGKSNDDFSQNISNKFNTVSTGYSDVYTGQNLENVFSIHRATIDLTTSNEKSKTLTKPSEIQTKVELTEQVPKIKASNETIISQSTIKIIRDNFDEKQFLSKKLNDNLDDIHSVFPDEEVRPSLFTNSEDLDNFTTTTSNAESGVFIEKPRNKEQKKELLKRVFEKANATKNKTKGRMKQLHNMLRVILTSDSSEHDEMVVTSNELVKDVTLASLRQNFLNETESMNNSYNIESMLSLSNESGPKYYPTKEQNSECSRSKKGLERNEPEQGCMCSTFAERLNMCGLGEGRCCCRGNRIRNEETSCDIETENDLLFMNVKTTELVDVETQQSNYFSGETVSANYYIQSSTKSNLITNKPTVMAQFKKKSANHIKTVSSNKDDVKERNTKVLNRNIALNISDEDRAILLKATPTNVSTDVRKKNEGKTNTRIIQTSDILQSHATKKAVLEIYAEKTMEEDGEHTVAKLPKFIYDKESEIRRYQQKLCHFSSVCKRNVVMMSVQR